MHFEKEVHKVARESSDSNVYLSTPGLRSIYGIKKWDCLRDDERMLEVRRASVVYIGANNFHGFL